MFVGSDTSFGTFPKLHSKAQGSRLNSKIRQRFDLRAYYARRCLRAYYARRCLRAYYARRCLQAYYARRCLRAYIFFSRLPFLARFNSFTSTTSLTCSSLLTCEAVQSGQGGKPSGYTGAHWPRGPVYLVGEVFGHIMPEDQ